MPNPKFNRACRIEFEGVNIDSIEDLRVQFEVDKNDGQQLNHASIIVYNMQPNARAAISRPLPLDLDLNFDLAVGQVVTVKLFVGYGTELVQIYSGDILWCHHNRVGPDWVTTMELYTGLTEATRSPTQVSFSKPTMAKDVLQAILQPLGLNVRFTQRASEVLAEAQVSDYTTSGMAYREADEFLRAGYGLAFTIEDEGQGLVYDPQEPRAPEVTRNAGNTISPDNGMIGTPRITKSGVELRTLLRPQTALFEKLFVEAATLQGTLQGSTTYASEYYAIHIKHSGDTRGEEWYTDIEGAYISIANRSVL